MKEVSAVQLTEAYKTLYPEEFKKDEDFEEVKKILENWLYNYKINPEKKIATVNWGGKVTKALFLALGIKMPKTKEKMLKTLE